MPSNADRLVLPRVVAAAFLLALSAGGVSAQAEKDDSALKGPAVTDNAPPGTGGTFGGQSDGKKKLQERGLGAREFMRALEVLRGESAGEGVRLTAAQEEQIKAAGEEFRAEVRAYADKHRDELTQLRAKLNPQEQRRLNGFLRQVEQERAGKPAAGEKGKAKAKPAKQEPAESDDMMSDGKAVDEATHTKARDRAMQLIEGAPQPRDLQKKVWAVLSAEQRPVVEAQVKRMQAELEKRRTDQMESRKGEKAPGAADSAKTPTWEQVKNDPRVPQQMKDRLERMSPEQRDEAIKRLAERRRQGAEQGGKGGKGEKGEKKKAPGVQDVNVPEPR
jgi:hypothetical protein